jgi:glycosyltransferase involved in cell wall biosynthesis
MIGWLLKFVSGARHFIWEMDVYPDIAVDLDVLGARSWIARLVGVCLDASRRNADGVIALSETMRDRLVRRGIPAERVHVAENWADGQEIQPQPFPAWHPLRILYSGNFGLAHDAATILGAMERFGADERLHFAFAGSGSQALVVFPFCEARAISNVSFDGYCLRRELSKSLGSCHIGLVTQKPATVGSIVPSKTYGIMAAGRPVLYIGPKEGTPARMVERFHCGWQVDPGDTAALIGLLEHLVANPAEVAEAGACSREAFLKHYDRRIGVARICSLLGLSQPQTAHEGAQTQSFEDAALAAGKQAS